MTNMDMSQYMDVFLDEGREQLALLETNVLEMERGNHTAEMLQDLFRSAHTLKGSSRAMGFQVVGELTHEMENILDDLRNDKLSVNTLIVNALLDCLDSLSKLIDKISDCGSDGDTVEGKVAELISRLGQLRTGSAEIAPTQQEVPLESASTPTSAFVLAGHEVDAIAAAAECGLSILNVHTRLTTDCVMKSVRVWMIIGAMEPLGTVLATNPNEVELESEEFDRDVRFLLATESDADAVTAAISTVSEIELTEVLLYAADVAAMPQVAESPVVSDPTPTPVIAAVSAMPEGPAVVAVQAQEIQDGPEKATAVPKGIASHAQTIRVEVSRLDTLLNLVGELVIERAQVHQICVDLRQRYPRDEEAAQLLETTHRIARVTSELQDQIMKTRMLPIDGVFQRMPRMVRDLAQKTGKELKFEMIGGETELDRTVLESLGDPLIHLLRNSVDHGIETPEERVAAGKPIEGLVTLSANHEENRIVIRIIDDGKGMSAEKLKASAVRKGQISEASAAAMSDRDALNLIFASGFSTAATVSEISGRGVGMDIVRSNIEKIGGRITVESVYGVGSQITIHLPMTLAIVRAVLVKANGSTYALPLGSVIEMVRIGTSEGEIQKRVIGQRPVISLRGATVPLANLGDILAATPTTTRPDRIENDTCVVVVGLGSRQIGICVDDLVGEQEVVIKSMGTLLGDIPGISGATILGDGQVALIVDVTKAAERIGSVDWTKLDNAITI